MMRPSVHVPRVLMQTLQAGSPAVEGGVSMAIDFTPRREGAIGIVCPAHSGVLAVCPAGFRALQLP